MWKKFIHESEAHKRVNDDYVRNAAPQSSFTTGNKTHRVVVWIFGVIGIIAVIAAVTIGIFHRALSTEYTVFAHSEKFENLRLQHAVAAIPLHNPQTSLIPKSNAFMSIVYEDGSFKLHKVSNIEGQTPIWNTEALHYTDSRDSYFIPVNAEKPTVNSIEKVQRQNFAFSFANGGFVDLYDESMMKPSDKTTYKILSTTSKGDSKQQTIQFSESLFIKTCSTCGNQAYAIAQTDKHEVVLYRMVNEANVGLNEVSRHHEKDMVGEQLYQGQNESTGVIDAAYSPRCNNGVITFLYSYGPSSARTKDMAVEHSDSADDVKIIKEHFLVRWDVKTGKITTIPLKNSKGQVLYGPTTVYYEIAGYINAQAYDEKLLHIVDTENGRVFTLDAQTGVLRRLLDKATRQESSAGVNYRLLVGNHEIVRIPSITDTSDLKDFVIERFDRKTGKLLKKIKVNKDFLYLTDQKNTDLYPGIPAVNPKWLQ